MNGLSTSVAEFATALVVALVGIAFGLQKLMKNWKESSTESSVLGILHTELQRMAAQNTRLAEELNKFQLEVMRLNEQLINLSEENRRLHIEVTNLTQEVGRLQQIIKHKDENEGT